jgi:hypothetical protein
MKNFILILLSLVISATTAHANTVRIGSGGDSQESEQVPEELLIDSLEKIQSDAQFLIHAWMWNLEKSPLDSEVLEKLRQVVINTPVQVVRNSACSTGSEDKDAVAYTSPTNSICISTLNLKAKLRIDNYKSQLLSLMIHEYSHLIGFDENQATKLQQLTMRHLALNGYAYPGPLQVNFYQIGDRPRSFRNLDSNKKELYQFLIAYITEAQTRNATYDAILISNYPALAPQSDYVADIGVRLNYLKILADGYQAPRADKSYQEELDQIFAGSASVTASKFNEKMRLKMVRTFQYPDAVLPRIDVKKASGEDFAKLVAEIEELDQKIQNALLNIYSGRNLVTIETAK